jgi:hypothetical protein
MGPYIYTDIDNRSGHLGTCEMLITELGCHDSVVDDAVPVVQRRVQPCSKIQTLRALVVFVGQRVL